MLIGFVFWYRGLAQGGIATVGQLQLLQPFFGLALAATLLHGSVTPLMLAVTVAVILCVAGARRFAKPSQGIGRKRLQCSSQKCFRSYATLRPVRRIRPLCRRSAQ